MNIDSLNKRPSESCAERTSGIILIIDDNNVFRLMIARILSKAGYRCLEARDGVEGLDMFRKHNPDAVLIDLNLPGLSGHDVLSSVVNESPFTPAIIASAAERLEDAVKSLKIGAWEYIIKPIDNAAEFMGVIEKCLLKSQLRRAKELYREQLEKDVRKRTKTLVCANRKLAREIVRRRTTEKELLIARDAAMEASRLKTEFLTNVTHELRTPLNGIMGMAELIGEYRLNADQQEYLALLRDSANHLLKLINDILAFSRLDSGQVQLVEIEFNPSVFIRSTIQPFIEAARLKGLEFSCFIAPETPERIVSDPGRLKQVIACLLDNAVKFTHDGGVCVKVEAVRNGFDEARLLFSVKDTGIGVAENRRNLIFNEFTQGDGTKTRKYGGTGLGLAIVREMLELMGGIVSFRSEVGKGSEFFFTIPLRTPAKEPELPEESRPAGFYCASSILDILIVEDEPVNRSFVMAALKRYGHNVHPAENGYDALKLLARKRFDIVFMDIEMKGMNGIEVTKRIRSREAGELNARVPVVALTAHVNSDMLKQCLGIGMNNFIAKPASGQDMIKVIEMVLSTAARN